MSNANSHGLLTPIYKVISKSSLIKTGVGNLRGIYCNASKGGTVEILDNVENGIPVIVREFSVSEGKYYKMADVIFGTGLYIVVGGVTSLTIYYF